MYAKLKHALPAVALGAAFVFAAPMQAEAQERARVVTDLNMRAGPGTNFPVVNVLNRGRTVHVHGCVRNFTWCDVTARGNRGWVSARYLEHDRTGDRLIGVAPVIGLPTITFGFGYWDHHYRDRHFYRDRHRWERDHWRGDRRWRDRDRWRGDRDRERWRDRDRG
jgi:uncharacterized protein YraI